MTTRTIADAVEAYRSNPGTEEASRLVEIFSGVGLFVPVGDFDGRNAALSFIHAREGGSYIPLFTRRDLVPEGQAAEEVGPADWMHILDQLPDVLGYAVNPYSSTNFAFTREFVEAVLARAESGDAGEEPEGEQSPAEPAPESVEETPSALVSEDTPAGTLFQIGEPGGVPESLEKAMQKVADVTGLPVWLLFVVPSRGENSYLMVIDGEEEWFETTGAEEINAVLSHFDDPGLALDFVIRSSELGAFVRDRKPHYVPAAAEADGGAQPESAAQAPAQETGNNNGRDARGEEIPIGPAYAGIDPNASADRAFGPGV